MTDSTDDTLPADLAAVAAAADAQLAAGELVPALPGAEAAAEQAAASEHQSIAGALVMLVSVAGMLCPPIASTYTPEACATIATEYLRCAERYGWTWHKAAESPVIGLAAAVALPAAMNAPAFIAWQRQRSQAASEPPAPLPPAANDERPHAGIRLA